MAKSFLKKYSDYLKDNPKGYWFKRRLYGWGWVPVTWQGWLIILGFIFVLLLNGVVFALNVGQGEPTQVDLMVFFGAIVISIILMFIIAYKKGEKPRWMWGLNTN